MLDNDAILERFRQIIGAHTGLVVPAHDTSMLQERLAKRLLATRSLPDTGGTNAERYLALLESDCQASTDEWRELVLALTTGESYFFRDTGQIRLLREILLPELLRTRGTEKPVRIWSAGCSTGEEPYSLAILMQQLRPPVSHGPPCPPQIKGTDINEYALQRARIGRYGRWAFRGVTADILENYFLRSHDDWLLDPTIKTMVQFEKLNLIRDLFPDPTRGLDDLDLIVCRNVFIYLNNDAIAGIMARFTACLRPGGYILTGHAEIQYPIFPLVESGVLPLQVRHFPDSIAFQRQAAEQDVLRPKMAQQSGTLPTRQPPPPRLQKPVGLAPAARQPTPPVAVDTTKPVIPPLQTAQLLFAQGNYDQAIQIAEPLLATTSQIGEVSLLLAKSYANRGELAKAEQQCQHALRHQPFASTPHFLLASIVHERGDTNQAKDLLNKTIYLDRAHVPAYLHLATIHQEEGSTERARQMRLAALDVLYGLPPTSKVEHDDEWTVAALVTQLEQALGHSEPRKTP